MLDTSACQGHFERVVEFAKEVGLWDQFRGQLKYLSAYANRSGCTYDKSNGSGKNTRCKLFTDFALQSFTFVMDCKDSPEAPWKFWFNGGLIYQGPNNPADGSPPSLTVSMDSTDHGWFVHT